jgi:hypothetical protein
MDNFGAEFLNSEFSQCLEGIYCKIGSPGLVN